MVLILVCSDNFFTNSASHRPSDHMISVWYWHLFVKVIIGESKEHWKISGINFSLLPPHVSFLPVLHPALPSLLVQKYLSSGNLVGAAVLVLLKICRCLFSQSSHGTFPFFWVNVYQLMGFWGKIFCWWDIVHILLDFIGGCTFLVQIHKKYTFLQEWIWDRFSVWIQFFLSIFGWGCYGRQWSNTQYSFLYACNRYVQGLQCLCQHIWALLTFKFLSMFSYTFWQYVYPISSLLSAKLLGDIFFLLYRLFGCWCLTLLWTFLVNW